MLDAYPFALDNVYSHGRAVQQQIHHVVVKEVDLVHVEDSPVGRGQNARLEVTLALAYRLFYVERADHPIFGRADRQVDEWRNALTSLNLTVPSTCLASVAHAERVVIETGKGASIHRFYRWQKGCQTPGGGRLGRTAFAPDQHAADQRMDCVQNQRSLHALLTDNRGEWINDLHRCPFLSRGQTADEMT